MLVALAPVVRQRLAGRARPAMLVRRPVRALLSVYLRRGVTLHRLSRLAAVALAAVYISSGPRAIFAGAGILVFPKVLRRGIVAALSLVLVRLLRGGTAVALLRLAGPALQIFAGPFFGLAISSLSARHGVRVHLAPSHSGV